MGQVFLSKKVFFYTCQQCKWRWFVSNNDEEPYSSIFASLKHPVRRKILRMLSKKPMSYSEMLEVLGVSNSFLTYHLENLGELVSKMEDGKYRLSSFGEDAMATMTRVEDIPSNKTHQSPQTKPKKIFGKSVALVLGLICIVLIAFIAYFAVAGISAQNSNSNLQNQYKQLQTWLTGNETSLNQTQTWLDGNLTLINQTQMWLSENVTAYNQLQNAIGDIHIGGTKNSTIWVNNETYPAYEGPTIKENNETIQFIQLPAWGFFVPSAGFISVLFSSNSTSTRVEVSYYENGTNNVTEFNPVLELDLGSNGMVVFPVSPSTTYSILLYNPLGESSEYTVTITYYY